MPLQTSGPISINDIAGEFGGAVPHHMSEYYRGSSPFYVPNGCEGIRGLVPPAFETRIGDYYGACLADQPIQSENAWYGAGPLINGVFVNPAAETGYSYYCLQEDPGVWVPGFGNYSGDRSLAGGGINEAFYGCIYLVEQGPAIYDTGIQFIMYNDAYPTYDYTFDYKVYLNNSGSPGSLLRDGVLDSNSATSDYTALLPYGASCSSGSRNARILYFALGKSGPGIPQTNTYIETTITRTNPL